MKYRKGRLNDSTGRGQAAPTRRIECIGDSIMCGAHSERGGPFPSDCADEHGGHSRGRVGHWVPTFIGTCSITAMIVCIFQHVPMEVGT